MSWPCQESSAVCSVSSNAPPRVPSFQNPYRTLGAPLRIIVASLLSTELLPSIKARHSDLATVKGCEYRATGFGLVGAIAVSAALGYRFELRKDSSLLPDATSLLPDATSISWISRIPDVSISQPSSLGRCMAASVRRHRPAQRRYCRLVEEASKKQEIGYSGGADGAVTERRPSRCPNYITTCLG